MTLQRLMQIVSFTMAAATLLMNTWWIGVASVGGRMPIIGYETAGGVMTGMVWLLIAAPILSVTVYIWGSLLVMVPVTAVSRLLAALAARRPATRTTSVPNAPRPASAA